MIKRELELAKTSSNLSASYTKKPCTVDDHQAKTIKVFAAGEYFLPPIRVNVCSKRYRSIDALFDEITARIPTLNYGARKLVSAEDKTLITDIEQLQNNGRYLCSDKADVNKIPSFDWDLYEKRIKHQQNFKTHFPPISSFDQFNKKHPTPKSCYT
uniref:Doublecortin domain-containing protein n=1 Tax=Rhabditophanes sp. KR3021 TaxID=114890 RepID=A0AC35TYK6_9BILA